MYNVLAEQVQIAIDELSDEPKHLMLLKLALDAFAEIAITELCDDVGVVLGVVDLVQLQHCWRVAELLEVLDLVGQQGSVDLTLEHLHVDDLDGHWFI
jgi:hypothetical protein